MRHAKAAHVVATSAATYVEVQGTAEGKPFSRAQMDELLALADSGIEQLFGAQRDALAGAPAAAAQRR